jgi:hypothetical protein
MPDPLTVLMSEDTPAGAKLRFWILFATFGDKTATQQGLH